MFENYFASSFHQSKARVCLSPAWLQHQVRHDCPAQLRTELRQEVRTQMLHLCGWQREESINIASWAALPTRRAGRYLHNGWEVALSPSSEGSTPLSASVASSGFGSSQPGGFLRLHTPGAWHLRRWELPLTETSLSSFQICPMDKPSIPRTKSGLWSQNSSSPFKAYQRLQLIPIINR